VPERGERSGRRSLGSSWRFHLRQAWRGARLDVGDEHHDSAAGAQNRTHFSTCRAVVDDRTGVRVGQADLERVGHELREQGLATAPSLENAQEGEVEIRHAIEEETDAVAGHDAKIASFPATNVAIPRRSSSKVKSLRIGYGFPKPKPDGAVTPAGTTDRRAGIQG